jgi:phosphonatase-like hydrolase
MTANGAGPIELAVLDIAGTTVQEHGLVYETLLDAVRDGGAQAGPADIAPWMGADKREAVRALLAEDGSGAPSDDDVERVHDDFRRRLSDAYARRPPVPYPGVPEALEELRRAGVRIALSTGFDRAITGPLLDSIGWPGDVIDAVVCADEVGHGRPAPYMIFRAMEATGVRDVGRVLVAGDTVLDVQAGTNAGAGFVVGVLTGGVSPSMLGSARHTHLLPGVAQLPLLLDRPS